MSEQDYEDFDSQSNIDKFMEDPGFGDGCDTNAPKSIQVFDLNQQKLRIYFKSTEQPISQLIKNYRQATTVKLKNDTAIYFLNAQDFRVVDPKQEIKKYYRNQLSTTITFYVSKVRQSQMQMKSAIEKKKRKTDDYFDVEMKNLYSYNQKLKQSQVKVEVDFDDEESEVIKQRKNSLEIQQSNEFCYTGDKSKIVSKIEEPKEAVLQIDESYDPQFQMWRNQQKNSGYISHPKSEPIPQIKKSIILHHGIRQKKQILYNKYQNFHIKTLVTYLVPNSRPSYCIKVGSQILRPNQRLDKLSKLSEFRNDSISCEVIKSYDKIVFINAMKDKQLDFKNLKLQEEKINKLDMHRKKVLNRVKDFQFRRGMYCKIEDICGPIQLYSSSYVFKEFNSSLRDLRPCEEDNLGSQKYYNFCSSLTNSLIEFDNYIGVVHRGMKNYKFSKFHKEGDCFFWQGFTSTTKSSQKALKFSNSKGSIFHITSLTGKDISEFSLYPSQKEVLFLPFTYFIVDKIIPGEHTDEVWLTELPSPETFTKNIILWVDDKPVKHTNYIKQIQKQNKNIEMIQLISTTMLQYWLRQFYWVLNWKGIQLKVISNMTRIQGETINHYAGVDVIQELDGQTSGYNVPVLIFCGDKEQSKKNIQEKGVKNKSYFITTTKSKLKTFCQF